MVYKTKLSQEVAKMHIRTRNANCHTNYCVISAHTAPITTYERTAMTKLCTYTFLVWLSKA